MQIPRLHPDTIAQVKERVDIVDIVSEQVVLRKRGKDYVGLCPFHGEKTPSFTVSPNKQMYYCFGCGTGGTAIKFLMEAGKQSFSEVVLDLARRYQIRVKTLEPEQRQELQRQLSLQEQLYEILALAASFYQHALRQPQGQQALEYLQSQRHLGEETLQQFQVGYAPATWETLYRYLVEQKGKPVQLVKDAGLILPRKSGDGYYDRFRDRIMIPIHDRQGRVIGFGGRALGDELPKYLNSPETPLFNKGKTLYALDKAYNAIADQDQAVVVEGYFDAIALHRVGIHNVVASLGTALSLDQMRLLLRYTESNQIILNFDADKAGTIAAERAIGEIADLAYKGQVQLRILNLPDGKDADEFLTHTPDGAEQYQQLLQNAPLWLHWQIDQLIIGKDLKQAPQFKQVAQKIVKLLYKLEDVNQQSYYINYCAEKLSLGESQMIPRLVQALQTQLNTLRITPIKKDDKSNLKQQNLPISIDLSISQEHSLLEEAEALLLRIYLHRPEYRQTIIDILDAKDLLFSLSPHRFLWQQILDVQSVAQSILLQHPEKLISLLQDRSIQFPEEMVLVEHLFHLNEKRSQDLTRTPLAIRTAAACLEVVTWNKHKRYCIEQWQKLNFATDPKLKEYYSQGIREAYKRLQELQKMRQTNILDIHQFAPI
ncbi:DNA primase catalytic core, N-terminal domain family [Coleofasciculus chthonoplastes PCC 7420]|uniref:DNA primase n=1 Tax=Coleofasciculus chthonoplastes PCC 7420 TaxID=118168 RepID=B4VZH0_9CYAN|nr:DNA primase [Coleofasciculus chthonoplastes]EDX72733.1 DNA primase catalytic core, N-terminal domain family [Coleofasciculus chthonoplastes PCC 7420]